MSKTSGPTQIAEFNNAWKGRGNLSNLVNELKRQKETRHDFVADVRNFRIDVNNGSALLVPTTPSAGEWLPDGAMPFNNASVIQLAEKATPSIPKRFFDEMLHGHGHHLAALLNGLHTDSPSKRLVRCLDGKVRAWLSDSYLILDNYDMAYCCMEEAQRKSAQVIEASLTDKAMRVKFTTQQVWDAIDIKQRSAPQGDWYAGAIGNKDLQGKTVLGARISGELPGGPGTVHPVVTVSNSETGHGGFHVRIGILMGICFNVATLEDVVTKIHLGERMEEGIYTAETRAAEAKAIMLKARDAIRAAFEPAKFREMVARAKSAQEDKIEKPISAVDLVVEAGQFNNEHKEALLSYFMQDYDQTRFGLAQAVSRLAQDIEDGDDAAEMERFAGKIIKEPKLVAVPA